MFTDAQLLLSDAQALTATAASTNLVDLGATERKLGVGEPMAVVIFCDVALAGTTPTFVATVESDSAAGFGSAATVIASASYSSIAAGSKIVLPIPAGNTERYLRLNYTLGGTTPTVTVTSIIQPMSMIQNDSVYADGFTIS